MMVGGFIYPFSEFATPKAELEKLVLGFESELASNALEVHLHHLRRKIGSDWIKNVRGVGYKLVEVAG